MMYCEYMSNDISIPIPQSRSGTMDRTHNSCQSTRDKDEKIEKHWSSTTNVITLAVYKMMGLIKLT